MKVLLIVFTSIMLFACGTQQKIVKVDDSTGFFPTDTKADVIHSSRFDIDSFKQLVLVGDGDFVKGQVENIGYWDNVITTSELEQMIVREGLIDEVPSVRDNIGKAKAFKHLQPYVWLRFKVRKEGNKNYAQLALTQPKDLTDVFVAERYLDYVWAGVHDQNTWYPLFNELIVYLKENSTEF